MNHCSWRRVAVRTYTAVLNSIFKLFVRCTSLNAILTRNSFCSCWVTKSVDPKRTMRVVKKLPNATTISNRFHPLALKLRQPRPYHLTATSIIYMDMITKKKSAILKLDQGVLGRRNTHCAVSLGGVLSRLFGSCTVDQNCPSILQRQQEDSHQGKDV